MTTIIAIGSDHRGFTLKQKLIQSLQKDNYKVVDYGTKSEEKKVDYPDYAKLVAKSVAKDANTIGILICNTGVGMAIAANRFKNVRAAVCRDTESAALARQHNNINVMVFGAQDTNHNTALTIVKTFLNTNFEGGRHLKRLEKIDKT
jgi:ribose 5-phosphate isomerase B